MVNVIHSVGLTLNDTKRGQSFSLFVRPPTQLCRPGLKDVHRHFY